MAIQIVPMIPQPQEVETLDFQIVPWVMLLHNSCFNNFVFKSSATTKLRYFNCTKRKNKNMKQTKKKKKKTNVITTLSEELAYNFLPKLQEQKFTHHIRKPL